MAPANDRCCEATAHSDGKRFPAARLMDELLEQILILDLLLLFESVRERKRCVRHRNFNSAQDNELCAFLKLSLA
jgi:hypothetical protein